MQDCRHNRQTALKVDQIRGGRTSEWYLEFGYSGVILGKGLSACSGSSLLSWFW